MNFPVEVLRQIFSHLDSESLKKCLHVSKESRDLIIKTPDLMRKLQVIFLNNTWETKIHFIEEFGIFVRSIRFEGCGFRSIKDVKNILSRTPNLESLIIKNCFIVEETPDVRELGFVYAADANHDNDRPEGEEENVNRNDREVEVAVEAEEAQLDREDGIKPSDDAEPVELNKLNFLRIDLISR